MDEVILVKPSVELKEPYLDFYREWVASGERLSPYSIAKDPTDFAAMVRELEEEAEGENLRDGYVPASTFWLINKEKRVLAAVNIRHKLTGALMNIGGHIGYGVRPSERRKGYAVRMLALALDEARIIGIERALVTCHSTNTGSEKTILKNGGMADAPYTDTNGAVIKRFWISLDK